jgi:hypothetical protein
VITPCKEVSAVGVHTVSTAAALRGGPNVVRVMREDLAVLATVVAP